ncbi:MAG TPA: hypothetical protein VIK92_05700 [Thermaerobacter sp.]
MPGTIKLHLLAVRSLVFGTCNLLVIGVPDGWKVVDGPFPPEVDRWFVLDGVNWAVAGRGHWRLAGPVTGERGHRPVVDASLELRPAAPGHPPADPALSLARVTASGTRPMGEHAARWALGEVRRGFPRRARPALAVTIACEATRRHLRLLLEGPDPGDLESLLPALDAGIRCH